MNILQFQHDYPEVIPTGEADLPLRPTGTRQTGGVEQEKDSLVGQLLGNLLRENPPGYATKAIQVHTVAPLSKFVEELVRNGSRLLPDVAQEDARPLSNHGFQSNFRERGGLSSPMSMLEMGDGTRASGKCLVRPQSWQEGGKDLRQVGSPPL